MNYLTECLIKFQSLPAIVKEAFGNIKTYADIKEIEDKYNIKLSFLVILIAIGELEEDDLEDYLIIKFKLSPAVAKNIKKEIVNKILDPIFEKIINTKSINNFVADKENIINLFSKRIIETLKAPSNVVNGLNVVIFKAFDEDDSLERKIIEIFYNNSEILTTNSFFIEDKEVPPTISNWLKDFIKINGSDMFDELKMAEYLSTSSNAKKLKQSEKDLLRKLLKLYRNLAFFPDSMGNDPIEDWQIIPIDKIEENKKTHKSEIFRDVLDDDKQTGYHEPNSSEMAPVGSLKPQEQIREKIGNAPLNELEKLLVQYAPGSLEYKAVKQEIERLKKKK